MGGVFAGLCILFVSLDIISRRLTHTSWLSYLLLCGGILQVLSGAASAIWFIDIEPGQTNCDLAFDLMSDETRPARKP